MVQEVQQQKNWYQDPNQIEWIWHIERKISDRTQVRDKHTRYTTFESGIMYLTSYGSEVFPSTWTYKDSDSVYYRVDGKDFYMAQWWGYLVHIIPSKWFTDLHEVIFRLYVDDKEVYTRMNRLTELENHIIAMNLGKENKITASFQPNWSLDSSWSINVTLEFIKL
jgi:hypothetical protein